MKSDPYFTPHTKVNSKWIKATNVRAKTIKLLDANIGQKIYYIGFGSDFLNTTRKAQATNEKNRQFGIHQYEKIVCIKAHYQ